MLHDASSMGSKAARVNRQAREIGMVELS